MGSKWRFALSILKKKVKKIKFVLKRLNKCVYLFYIICIIILNRRNAWELFWRYNTWKCGRQRSCYPRLFI